MTRAEEHKDDGRGIFDTTYDPFVAFEYEYEGRPQSAANIGPATDGWFDHGEYWRRTTAESVVEPYAVGEEVTVHVDPEEPWEGFLVDGTTWHDVFHPSAKRAILVMFLFIVLVPGL